MTRLIDADALKKALCKVCGMRHYCKSHDDDCWEKRRIDEQPTVDAVPVVRCGECKRHEEPRDTGLKAFVWCNFYNMYKLKDGYCNCGERKDGERR